VRRNNEKFDVQAQQKNQLSHKLIKTSF